MLFETQEKADEAAKALVEGKAFKEVAKELAGQDASATDFGKATRNELLEGMADAVFTTEKGSYTPPLASPLGFHIFKVVDVTAAKPLPFKQVKDAIKRAIVEEKMMEYRYTLVNQLQDALASGSSLEDVAEAFNLSLKKATTIDNNGLNADGNAAKLPKEPIFLATVFSLDEGAEPELVTNKEGTASYIIRVDGAQQARLRALDEVRGKVVAAWKKEESGQQRKTLAQKAVKALKEDSTLSKEASRFGASVQTVSIARADNKKSELPAILVEEAFTIEKGKTTGAYANPEGDLVIARVAAVVPASEHLSEETREQILRAHKEGYVEDMFRQYTIYLQRQYPVEVFIDMNETAN
jgi:peptidyl-prolyl cis-trans isomerase D